jgi:hypothetical protein
MFKKAWEWFTSGWWGNVTASVIATIIFTKLWDSISPNSFRKVVDAIWGFLKPIFTYQVSIWYAFAIIAAWYFFDYLIRRLSRKKNVEADAVWKKAIGNYTFGDLRDILLGAFLTPIKIPGRLVNNGLVNFYKYAIWFNEGLGAATLNDDGFAYMELAPYLALHQLVDKHGDIYQLNDNGNLLYSSLAITFKDYPEYRERVYGIQVAYVKPTTDITYTQEEVNKFKGLSYGRVRAGTKISLQPLNWVKHNKNGE